MGDVLAQLREQYDFIVVDTPPVLPVADTLLLGQHADAALFSILRDVSRVPKVHAACERLHGLGIRILGAVVAGARVDAHGAEYYYTAAYAADDQEAAR
jgi:Mrp family chromosome partitioning ATPase